jgi:DNA-binding MarR family transcriptional regulator
MDDQLIKELIKYVKDTLDIALIIQQWDGRADLPFFLRDRYAFYQTKIMTLPCILMVANSKQETTPAVIRKNIDLLRPKTCKTEIIYIRKQLSSFNRKRLVEQKVCFIIPGNQMYLPFLGMDFREHFRKLQSQPRILSPSGQLVILHALLKGNQDILRLNDLAEQYGYSVMTMSRAFSEIESLGLAEVTIQGRKREMILKVTKQEVWEKSLEFLRNPVMQRLYLDQSVTVPDGIYAGLSALARYSSLAESANTVWAISSAAGRLLTQKYRRDELSVKDLHCNEIEVWSYDPKLFAAAGVVDRLSLFLSLRDEKDERVEAALEQMMKEMPW